MVEHVQHSSWHGNTISCLHGIPILFNFTADLTRVFTKGPPWKCTTSLDISIMSLPCCLCQIFSKNCSAVDEAFANQSVIKALSYYISK